MRTAAKTRDGNRTASLDESAATDEILQVMYWLRSENIAQEFAPNDLTKWDQPRLRAGRRHYI